jgi:hypothetical protein
MKDGGIGAKVAILKRPEGIGETRRLKRRTECAHVGGTTMAESKGRLFAKLMDEELSKLDKGPDKLLSRGEFLDALRAVHDRAPTEIQEDIYALTKALMEALKALAP